MNKNNLNKRFRIYSGVRNFAYDTHDKDGNVVSEISEIEWRNQIIALLSSVQSCDAWFVFHDKDVIPATDVSPEKIKPLHCHFVLIFENARWPKSVMTATGTNENELENVRNIAGSMRYLTHTTTDAINQRKYRYSIDELYFYSGGRMITGNEKRVAYTDRIVGKEIESDRESAFVTDLTLEILRGHVLSKDLRSKFVDEFGERRGSTLFMKERKALLTAVDQFKKEYIDKKRTQGRSLVTVYVDGDGGSGKTTLSKMLCQYENKCNGFDTSEIFTSATTGVGLTSDPFQKYNYEYSTHLDEFMPEQSLSFSDFNKTFEQNGVVDVASRMNSKSWLSDFCVISKSRPLTQTVAAIGQQATDQELLDPGNVKRQIQRRMPLNITVTKMSYAIKRYDKKLNAYVELKTFKRDSNFTEKELKAFLEEVHELIEEIRSEIAPPKFFNIDTFI